MNGDKEQDTLESSVHKSSATCVAAKDAPVSNKTPERNQINLFYSQLVLGTSIFRKDEVSASKHAKLEK